MRHIVPVCGISWAISTTDGLATVAIDAQLSCQHHRGPDATGQFAGRGGVIAQNRLSIIDLVQGDPPITNEDRSIGVVLNGEIYNFLELREGLLADRHQFRSHGDTEVIAHLAESNNAPSLARHLDGMFAFAVWDSRRQVLMLGRDRCGKKPLHYWYGNGTLVFASEIKGVLAHPAVPREMDARALSAYLTFGYVPTPHTFFSGIKSVPPAHTLTISLGGEPHLERYWQLAPPGLPGSAASLDIGMEEAAGHVRDLFEKAIRRRLIADVPLGAFLSGGIDSSAIVAMMAGVMGEPVKTFTIGFQDTDGFDERPYARAVARQYSTEHHDEVVHPEAVDLVERLVWHHDQPFGDSSAIPTFLLNQVARNHVTVALSGDGGDELFGGYERFAAGLAVERALALPQPLRAAGERLITRLPSDGLSGRIGRAQRFVRTVEDGMPWAYLDWISYVREDWRQRLLPQPDGWGRDDYGRMWDASAGAKPLDRILALNLQTYLPDDLLVKADRMSMAHGLEVRSPFLDTDLLEFAVQLPPALKVRGLSLKRVLKKAVSELLPDEILSRPKRGFGVPLDRWFREDLASYTSSALGAGARVREHLNGEALDRLLAEHSSGGTNHGHALWTILTLEVFLRQNDW